MQKYRILKGYARVDCKGKPDLCTFTQDLTKSGSIEWAYIEVKYPTCNDPAVIGNKMIDFNYHLTRVILGSNTYYKTRKSFITGSTKVWRDGVLMTPNDGSSDTYDYSEVGNNKILFNFTFDYDNTNVSVEYETL